MERFGNDGLTFDVIDAGPTGGDVVILLHGFPEDATSFDLIAARLHAVGLRTLVPDQRGYSPGARPRGRWHYTLPHLVSDVIALADESLTPQFHLVGHDWGAAVAWEVARRHPDRVRSLTALSVPHLGAVRWALGHSDQARRSRYMAAFQLPVLPERQLSARLGPLLRHDGMTAEMARYYGKRYADPSSLTGPLAWYRALPLSVLDRSAGRAPTDVTVPTTYLWGTHDHYVSRAAAERCAHHVTADYRFVELDASHWLPENNADDVAPHVVDRIRSI